MSASQTSKPLPDANEPAKITSLELARLAATLNPAGCRSGGSRDALLHALALFEESEALCLELAAMNLRERLAWLREAGSVHGNDGAAHLYRVITNPIRHPPVPVLTLALRDADADTLRPYLAEHASFEGKTNRKSWFRVRTIHDNLRAWLLAYINRDNTANAAFIRARDERDRKEAKQRGCSVEELRIGHGFYTNEVWQDAEQFCAEWFARHEVHKDGKLSRYEIPQELVDNFIRWKREIRQQPGGIKKVRVLTREEVLAPPAKRKITKKEK